MVRSTKFGRLEVCVGDTTGEMAAAAAAEFARAARRMLREKAEINVVFAGAESQGAFHAALRSRTDIPWERVNAFAVDEFLAPGLPAANAVSAQPMRDLYVHVPVKSVNVIAFDTPDPEAERARYEALLRAHPPDLCAMGIGISGHLALNEPGETDFNDPLAVRIVTVCDESKRQLESDPNFCALPSIPDRGITITVPFLLSASSVLVVAPYALKAPIIRRLRDEPVSPALPASILTTCGHARLYLDRDSASLLGEVA
jgi:glucosamine-6-phosphate deaminase